MKLFTSNFATSARDLNAVAISRGVPVWFKGKKYPALAPEAWMIKKDCPLSEVEWTAEYHKRILSKLNAKKVLKDLGSGSVLLCWEKPGEFCHRRIVAAWLEKETGIECPELFKEKPAKKKEVEQMSIL
jgi:hypothetical protein